MSSDRVTSSRDLARVRTAADPLGPVALGRLERAECVGRFGGGLVRRVPGEDEPGRSPAPTSKSAYVAKSRPYWWHVTCAAQTASGPAIATIWPSTPPHPRDHAAVVEPQPQLRPHRTRPLMPSTIRTTSGALSRGGMKSITRTEPVGRGPLGLQDEGVTAVVRRLHCASPSRGAAANGRCRRCRAGRRSRRRSRTAGSRASRSSRRRRPAPRSAGPRSALVLDPPLRPGTSGRAGPDVSSSDGRRHRVPPVGRSRPARRGRAGRRRTIAARRRSVARRRSPDRGTRRTQGRCAGSCLSMVRYPSYRVRPRACANSGPLISRAVPSTGVPPVV